MMMMMKTPNIAACLRQIPPEVGTVIGDTENCCVTVHNADRSVTVCLAASMNSGWWRTGGLTGALYLRVSPAGRVVTLTHGDSCTVLPEGVQTLLTALGVRTDDALLTRTVHDDKGRIVLVEDSAGNWSRHVRNADGFVMRFEHSTGRWVSYVRDEANRVLREEHNNGYLVTRTYDKFGNDLTLATSEGSWSSTTRDDMGRILTHDDSDGHWTRYTRDEDGNELTMEGHTGVWQWLAQSGPYTLYRQGDRFEAGCFRGSLADALVRWGEHRTDERAVAFRTALLKLTQPA